MGPTSSSSALAPANAGRQIEGTMSRRCNSLEARAIREIETSAHSAKSPEHKSLFSKVKFTKRKQFIKFLLLKLFLMLDLLVACHAALLTNLYSKQLSELTGDLSHRYLLIQNPSSRSTRPSSIEQVEFARSQSANEQPNKFVKQADNSSGGYSNWLAAPLPSPLALAWKQQTSGQQQQQQRPPKLTTKQSGNMTIADPCDMMAIENAVTEFPNPNINNLGSEITKILCRFFQHGYDKRVRPKYSGPPVMVNVSFHIIGISSVDEVQMDFTTDFYFRQEWYDPRLEFDQVGDIKELCVGAEFAERIWLPDTFFANEKTATFHKATTENTFIRIGKNGRVYRSIRLTVTCSCQMDLQYFPMDRQRCKIEIESYGYSTDDIEYNWKKSEKKSAAVSMNKEIQLPQFRILGFRLGQELQFINNSGTYSRLFCEIHFVRSMGYYLFQIYIPASLIVMISWVSFWLHRNATPARVALGVTTVLTMTTLMSNTNAALPKISYIKSIDVFLGTCFVMVFAALLEYASVGYIGKRIAMKRKRLQDLQQMQQHHQKVCVAAAASAAATAAAAAHEAKNFSPGTATVSNSSPWSEKFAPVLEPESTIIGTSQTLGRRSTTVGAELMSDGSKTIQRARATSSGDAQSCRDGQFSSIKVLLGDTRQLQQNKSPGTNSSQPSGLQKRATSRGRALKLFGQAPSQQALGGDPNRTPILAAGAAIAATAAANQQSHGPTTEFEVNQTHDMVRICGLMPSDIDKHSRVVFPVCFVCFNLMYWIIYGHISQQVEDKGLELIPFNNKTT